MMAKLKFLKPGEKSEKKNYKPESLKWKSRFKISILFNIISSLVIIYLLSFIH